MGALVRPSTTLPIVLALALAAGAGRAFAQDPGAAAMVRVTGKVLDSESGSPVPQARVWFLTGGEGEGGTQVLWSGLTDEAGAFASAGVAMSGFSMRVEALGFKTATGSVEAEGQREVEVRIELVPEPLGVDPLVVVLARSGRLESAGFYNRRRQGQGYSMTREEFEGRRPQRASDLFRLMPGVSLQQQRRGGAPVLRYRGCVADLVLDGVPLTGPTAIDDVVSVADIEGVEVHSGIMFPASIGAASCATVMIWTREGGRDEKGRPMTRRRLLAIVGFVALSILLTR
ncbi:MAG: carboxypeptidase regulatory-like domain-containing protein [Longimicrobiales bacterium]|nr:carboxypeptidase regulatory-like domain-containing protein [Longimicrobiales bacterium]